MDELTHYLAAPAPPSPGRHPRCYFVSAGTATLNPRLATRFTLADAQTTAGVENRTGAAVRWEPHPIPPHLLHP